MGRSPRAAKSGWRPFLWVLLLELGVFSASGCGRALAQESAGVSFRGDADCSFRLNAADVVATVRALGGSIVCGNGDCDRDGTLTPADADCAARCLFGECPIPSHAPRVTEVALDGVSLAQPFAALRIVGVNFASEQRLLRATIGGVEAEVVDVLPQEQSGAGVLSRGAQGEEELIALIPPIASGSANLVVSSGDLAGFEFPITVDPVSGVGDPDTFQGSLDLLDQAVVQFAGLDLETVYEDAAGVRADLERFHNNLASARAGLADEPNFTGEVEERLDQAVEASGVPERLRGILADISSTGARGYVARGPTIALGGIAKNLGDTIAIARSVVVAGGSGIAGGIAGLLGVTAAVLAETGAVNAVIEGLNFFDANGRSRLYPTESGRLQIQGRRLAPASQLALVVRTPLGEVSLLPEATDPILQYYFLSEEFRFCGQVEFFLQNRLTRLQSARIRDTFQPELLGMSPNRANPGEGVMLTDRGWRPCPGSFARIEGRDLTALFPESRADIPFCPTCGGSDFTVPYFLPGTYRVTLGSGYVLSLEQLLLTIRNAITGLQIRCGIVSLKIPPGDPSTTECRAVPIPEGLQLPEGSRLSWTSSDRGTATVVPLSEGRSVVTAKAPGETLISAVLLDGDTVLASTPSPVKIDVKDNDPPFDVNLTTELDGLVVGPGADIPVTVTADDNFAISRIVLHAMGDAVLNPEQEDPCGLGLLMSCEVAFTVHLREAGFFDDTVTLVARAFDTSGNSTESNRLTFTIGDARCPVVTIESPVNGSFVEAGATVRVDAQAADTRGADTGVVRWRYSASGPALVRPVFQELPLPMPQREPSLSFTFEVKPEGELAGITDRVITITVEAIDADGNSCPQSITVSVPAPFVQIPLSRIRAVVQRSGVGAEEIADASGGVSIGHLEGANSFTGQIQVEAPGTVNFQIAASAAEEPVFIEVSGNGTFAVLPGAGFPRPGSLGISLLSLGGLMCEGKVQDVSPELDDNESYELSISARCRVSNTHLGSILSAEGFAGQSLDEVCGLDVIVDATPSIRVYFSSCYRLPTLARRLAVTTGRRGQTLGVFVLGLAIGDATSADFGPGIAATVMPLGERDRALFNLAIAPDAPLGPRPVTIFTPRGAASGNLVFTVVEGS
jgi:hypothetical protein